MIKTSLIALPDDGIECVEIERLQSFLSNNGYKTECIHLNEANSINEHYSKIDLESKLYFMYVFSDSSVYPKSIIVLSELAQKIKRKSSQNIVVFGGKYVSIYYKEILKDNRFSNIDYIVLGDTEYTMLELINSIENNIILSDFVKSHKNIASKNSLNNKEFLNININDLPLPDRTILKKNKSFNNYYATICDSHGCCMNCSYCTRGQFYKKWTGRSAESLFYEIKNIYIQSSVKCFWFTGGSFEDPGGEIGKKKIRDFCNLIIENNIKVSMKCYIRSNFVSTVEIELLKLMKKAGFHVALVGVESGNELDLQLYNKGTTIEKNKITLHKLREANIYTEHFGFIMINPYSTPERLQANYHFLNEQQPHDLDNYVHHVVADPGTAIRKQIEEDGLIIPNNDFLKMGTSYRFVNEYAADVSAFLHQYFLIFNTETAGITTFIFHVTPFLPNGKIYEEKITSIMRRRAKIYSEYFRILYIDMDIGLCERQYSGFMAILNQFDIEITNLKNKVIKDLIRYKIM